MSVNLRMEKIFKMRLMNRRLVHAITNPVTMRDMANAILAVGGSPIMADCYLEIEEVARIADAAIINLGMLNEEKKQAINGVLAFSKGKVLLDPIGIAISSYRKSFAKACLSSGKVNVVKGNRAEILALADMSSPTIGIDANDKSEHDIGIYQSIAKKYNVIVVVTDQEDIITDGEIIGRVKNGSKMLQRITGAGCVLGGIIASFMAQGDDDFEAVLLAVLYLTIASEIAEEMLSKRQSFGSFNVFLHDQLGKLTFSEIIQYGDYELLKQV